MSKVLCKASLLILFCIGPFMSDAYPADQNPRVSKIKDVETLIDSDLNGDGRVDYLVKRTGTDFDKESCEGGCTNSWVALFMGRKPGKYPADWESSKANDDLAFQTKTYPLSKTLSILEISSTYGDYLSVEYVVLEGNAKPRVALEYSDPNDAVTFNIKDQPKGTFRGTLIGPSIVYIEGKKIDLKRKVFTASSASCLEQPK